MNAESAPASSTQAPSAVPESVTMSLDAAFELAQSHHAAGRLPPAERIYLSILQAVPNHPRALYLLGVMALQLDRYAMAESQFRAVLGQRPGSVDAWVGLSSALSAQGQSAQAEAAARRAVALDGSSAQAHSALGSILVDQSRHSQAAASYSRAIALEPRAAPLMSSLLNCMAHDEAVDAEHLARMHRQFGKKFGANLRGQWQEHANPRDPDKRLRVGFVSGDLRQHAVAYFLEPLWRAFDSSQVELFAYSNLQWEDATSQSLRSLVERWRPVLSLDDAQLAQQVREDGIDILIDLSGHTVRNRLLTFACRPAPVQASWLGYPETTGLTAIDYYLADPNSAPPGPIDALYVERLVRLPASVAFQPDPGMPEVNSLPALHRGQFTFGSFNRTSKLGPTVLATWSRILQQVPGSRLLMANVSDAAQAADLRQRFAVQGVSADRLSFVPRMPLADYFRLHHEVDVLLDTFPYTGGTTTQHALSMGVPVVTLAGLRRSERISAANLIRVGLGDWSVTSTQAYVARAIAAAADLPGLAAVRAGLRERIATSPLRDAGTIARGFEVAFRCMWQRWCEGLPPQAFSVTLEQAARRAST